MATEMECFVAADEGASRADYEAFMKTDIRFPRHFQTKGSHLWRVFDQHRNPDDHVENIKGDASELLGLYSLMRHFVELRFQDAPHELAAERASFNACCNVVDTIMAMKQGVIDCKSVAGCRALEDAIFEHLRRHIATYGLSLIHI